MKYKLYRDVERDEIIGVFKYHDNKTSYIPMSADNTDYQEYLKWLAKGNKAMEADEA